MRARTTCVSVCKAVDVGVHKAAHVLLFACSSRRMTRDSYKMHLTTYICYNDVCAHIFAYGTREIESLSFRSFIQYFIHSFMPCFRPSFMQSAMHTGIHMFI